MRPHQFLLLFATPFCLAASPSGPVVTNAHGSGVTYNGLYANDIEAFVGIRYGQDTGGENRFRPPVPYTPAAGSTIDATSAGPACPQRIDHRKQNPFNAYSYVTEISEDCLRLNVWRPNGTKAGDKLPVLVYIYGGGFNSGEKDGILNQPGGMELEAVKMGQPVMNVAMNYRLGIFGFAKTAALAQEGSLNAGVRDQRSAIEWVHENIAAFGGDPDRITIHGQSSGGLAIGIQMLAYGNSRPYPFQQAIAESQILEPDITGNVTRHSTARVWKKTSCVEYSFDSAANADCLRKQPMEELLKWQLKTHSASPKQDQGDTWLPSVDGDFLPEAPSALIAQGKFNHARAVMAGWCDNDALLFTPEDNTTPNETRTWLSEYLPAMTDPHLQQLLSLYPESDFQNTYFPDGKIKQHAEFYRLGRIYRDILFTCQPVLFGQALHKEGIPVYYYNQNQTMLTPPFHKVDLYGLGVVHTSELIYVFGNLTKYNLPGWPYHPRASDHRLRVQESRSWAHFAATGNPSGEGLNTIQGWKSADFVDQNYGAFVIGGPTPGYSGSGGSEAAIQIMAGEKLTERCGFLNSPEIVKEIQY